MVTLVTIVNNICSFTFVESYLFTKEKCFIFVKNYDYARKIVEIDEFREVNSQQTR